MFCSLINVRKSWASKGGAYTTSSIFLRASVSSDDKPKILTYGGESIELFIQSKTKL